MQESKIVATKRLQDEGHWNEASLYREGIRETLRSEGMTRKEANRVAWEKMLEVFPPFSLLFPQGPVAHLRLVLPYFCNNFGIGLHDLRVFYKPLFPGAFSMNLVKMQSHVVCEQGV